MANEEDLERMRKARMPNEKRFKQPIDKISKKKLAQKEAEKKLVSSDGDTLKEQWFKARRKEMTGVCAFVCGDPSQKHDNILFRSSAAHILPKCDFESVMYHPFNYVERRFWAGINGGNACHTMMDEAGLGRWPNMEDWPDIKAKFMILAPLLTEEEKGKKFYLLLKKLVYAN